MTRIKGDKKPMLTIVLFTVYLLALAWLILLKLQFRLPTVSAERVMNLIPLRGSLGENGVLRFSEIRNNMIAFVPLGIFLCMLKKDWTFTVKIVIIFAISLVFESIQFIFAIGRADITDILSNTLGGLIGIGMHALAFRFLKDRTNRVIQIVAAVVAILALLLISFLLANHRWIRIQ